MNRKLTNFQRWQIAKRYANGEATRKLAKEFGVSPTYPAVLCHVLIGERVKCPHCGQPMRKATSIQMKVANQ